MNYELRIERFYEDCCMSYSAPFPPQALESRLSRVREHMNAQGLSACLISSPENIYYLTGLDHWGFFALHLLVVPKEGALWLITRAMEHPTVQAQNRVIHAGYR